MDCYPGAPVRSRSSQSQSPSHSASASASSSIHRKRKFQSSSTVVAPLSVPTASVFSLSETGAMVSNDDLESISAREEEDDSEEDDDDAHDSMRTFTNVRVDMHNNGIGGSGSRIVKPRKSETVKMENFSENGVGKDNGGQLVGMTGSVGLMSGIVVKDDTVKGIFTENIQTSGAYCTREEGLKREVSY